MTEQSKSSLFAVLYIIGIIFASIGASRYPIGDPLFYPLFSIGLVFLAAGLYVQRKSSSPITEENQ
ncbi:MAG: hypothetical protein ACFFEF_18500 [Candidatus Thorarchaeota archaeon]